MLRTLVLAAPLLLAADQPASFTIQTVAGTSFAGDGGAATSSILSQPEGLVIDAAGNLYIADADDSRVRKVGANGLIQTVAGNGVAGFSGDGGPGNAAQLDHPYGIALDTVGNLYIADLGNARVRKVSTDGIITTLVGGASQTSAIKLIAPRNVAIDRTGTLYIADFGANQIYSLTQGGVLSLAAGTGKAGFSGDNAAAKLAQLSAPAGLALDAGGSLYIADSGNGRVRKLSQGVITSVFTVAGPTGLVMSAAGTLYVSSPQYFGTLTRAVGLGIIARDVTTDAAGYLYLSVNNLVERFAPDGSLSVKAGNGASRYYGGDGGAALSARLHNPSGLAQDDLGNVYIADTDNHRIRKIDASGVMTTFAGTGEAGAALGNGMGMLAQFTTPKAVAVDSLRNVYVADSGNNRICKITQAGLITVVVDKLSDPEAVALDSNGVLYIADTGNNRILKGGIVLITGLQQPAGLAVDSSGAVYISESTRVSRLPPAGLLTTVLDGLKNPRGLAITSDGSLLIAEAGAQRIRSISVNGIMAIIAGSGVTGYSGDGGPSVTAQLTSPSSVMVDTSGDVWIADSGNHRIRELTPSGPAPVVGGQLLQLPIVNAASLAIGAIAPEEIFTLFGSGFDATQTQVLFDGIAATIFYASPSQLNVLAPANLKPGGNTDILVTVKGTAVAEMVAPVSRAVPGMFAAALNEDGSLNSAANPAARGSIAVFFATGWSTGTNDVGVSIGGYDAVLLYAGVGPGLPGLKQINARVPSGFLPPGNQQVVVTVLGVAAPGMTLVVR